MKNQDGLWRLSPSGLYGYTDCPSCFWLEQHYDRPPSIPPVLNMAMDQILKNRFDSFRAKGELPPEIKELEKEGISLFPDVETLNVWRSNTKALEVRNEKAGYILAGKLDEVFVTRDRRYIPVDYKSSGYEPKEDKQKYYVLQLNAYALMFREHGLPPADRAYLVHYFIKDTKNASLAVEFKGHLDPVKIDLDVLEKTLANIVHLLNGPYPGDNLECKNCVYYKGRENNKKTN